MQRRVYLRSLTATVGAVGATGCLRTAGDEPTTTTEQPRFRTETVTMELEVPWGAAFAPDGDLYLTERPGRVQRVAHENGRKEQIADLTDVVAARGEGGLLGLAIHPGNSDIAYTYQTYEGQNGLTNRVVRHRISDDFVRESVVFDGIPGASIHDGGRIAFGPGGSSGASDGALYVATGDAGESGLAQDRESLAGKVLRLTPDGEPHPDNPFGNAVFTYGHRNPQGLAWREGTLFSTEHGPSSDDEINVLRAGNNYGWPEAMGPTDGGRFTDPIESYTPAIAPGSATFYHGPVEDWRGDFFFGTLAGTHLHRVRIDDNGNVVGQQRLLDGKYGRLRTVFTGPEDHLYVTTSNRDGRGTPAPQDDRVLRIQPV
ncbi:PQQ-dependent sugar dehydrogenase [Halorussus sp. MSC15.2]|uniref:PQQ-dependent sugar dehydrogenase n=1 Tax=Halorussus sp. MSC15.2 TaxID=2283638 RepID=UPI0013D7BE0A|nr:PQQ-dependent sugar dehydrogenase [Halorussus sp. MSC15.2]NEU55578.1 PQQ-dependent sugar dehydrogenase [Halorussus sp. MSC15.2]